MTNRQWESERTFWLETSNEQISIENLSFQWLTSKYMQFKFSYLEIFKLSKAMTPRRLQPSRPGHYLDALCIATYSQLSHVNDFCTIPNNRKWLVLPSTKVFSGILPITGFSSDFSNWFLLKVFHWTFSTLDEVQSLHIEFSSDLLIFFLESDTNFRPQSGQAI